MATRVKALLTIHGITPQEEEFCQKYLLVFNGTHAAISVGISPKSAAHWASSTYKRPAVKARIDGLIVERRIQHEADKAKLVREMQALAYSRHHHYDFTDDGKVIIDGIPTDDADAIDRAHAAIRSVERETRFEKIPDEDDPNSSRLSPVHKVKITLWDKNTAQRQLGTHYGMFIERTATAEDGDNPDGEKTVWNFGGKEIEF